ncbi:MAG TPA: EamA family transporter [Sutterella sp.]|nr:EamA family transporter [Sutterella sp.]
MQSLRGPLFVLAGGICFGISGTLQALAPEGATPFVIGGTRMLMSGAALFLLVLLTSGLPKLKGLPLKSFAIVTFAMWLYQITFFEGLLYSGVAVGTVVSIGTTPIATGLLTWILTKKAPNRQWYLATVLAITGVVLLNYVPGVEISFAALLLPVTAGVCYALELYWCADMTRDFNPMSVVMAVHLVAGLCLVPFFFFYPFAWVITGQGMLTVVCLGVLSAALPFSLLFYGMRTTAPAVGATLGLAEPMTASILGIALLGEACRATTVAGIVCIFVAILVLVFGHPLAKKH